MIKLIDTHTHLEEIEGIANVIRRARKAGVLSIITMGSDFDSCQQALEIAGRYDDTAVYPALGIHPWHLETCQAEPTISFIEENIGEVVAIGEIGLDYWLKEAKKDLFKRNQQKEVFRRLLHLSRQYEKPAVIHSRGAWEDCFDLTVKAGIEKAVFHWYNGPLEILDKILTRGYFISATPAAEYSYTHQSVIAITPLDKILLETDSPTKYYGNPSEPADILRTMEAVAKIKNIRKEEVANITTQNAFKFFELEY